MGNRYKRPIDTLKENAGECVRQASKHSIAGRKDESERCAKAAENYRDAADILEDVGEPDASTEDDE